MIVASVVVFDFKIPKWLYSKYLNVIVDNTVKPL